MNIYHQPWRLEQNKIRGRGGREIDKFRGVYPPVDDQNGSEAWIGSVTHVGNPPEGDPWYGCSKVFLPDDRKMYLFEAIKENPEEVLGKVHMEKNGTGMGVLIKYLDAWYQYELQCHPTREWALKMWDSPYGKEESWYVIGTRDDTEEPAYILLGFKEGITRELWEKYYREDNTPALESLCHKIYVKPGDIFFVGGGCPHALGVGCLVIEVQEPSDITLDARPLIGDGSIDRWGNPLTERDRELYDERLLGGYTYDGHSYEENLSIVSPKPKTIRSGEWGSEKILIGPDQTSFFSFSRLEVNGRTEIRHTGFPQVCICTAGSGRLTYEGGEMEIKKADELFFPYDIKDFHVEGDCTLILCNPEGVSFPECAEK